MKPKHFRTKAKGDTPLDAFFSAKEDAADRFGHNGYTGQICEKDSFVIFIRPKRLTPLEIANILEQAEAADPEQIKKLRPKLSEDVVQLLVDAKKVHQQIDGPAVCIPDVDDYYVFCGSAY